MFTCRRFNPYGPSDSYVNPLSKAAPIPRDRDYFAQCCYWAGEVLENGKALFTVLLAANEDVHRHQLGPE